MAHRTQFLPTLRLQIHACLKISPGKSTYVANIHLHLPWPQRRIFCPATVDPPTPKRGGRRIAVGVARQPVPPDLGVGGGATSVWPYDHPVQFCKLGTGPLSQFDHGRAQGVKRTYSFPNRWSALPVAFRCFVHGRCHYQIQHWARTGSNGG